MKPSLTFILVFLFYWFEPTIQILTRRRFLKEAKFVVDYLHQLSIIPLRIHNVGNSFDCAFKCVESDECLSFNLARFSGGLKECQLLSADKCNSIQHLNASTIFDYYSVSLGLVHGNNEPCMNGGHIQPFYWTGTYKCACPPGTEGTHCENLKLSTNPINVGSKDSAFGKFYAPRSGQIKMFKLVHVSGGLTCWKDFYSPTTFGCHFSPNALCMMITDSNNNVVSPPQSYYSGQSSKCYTIPGMSNNDKELILPEISPALNVIAGQELRVWYSEDLFDIWDGDNDGVLYTHVYANYVES